MRAAALSMGALLALASAGAQAQLFETERMLTTPVEPGVVAPHRPTAAHAGDVGETGSLQVAAAPGSTLQDWYTRQGRPRWRCSSTAASSACRPAGTARPA